MPAACTAPVPDPERCRQLLEEHGVPDHIRRHSEQVARVARRLAEALRRHAREAVDVELVEAGALLHDIAKASCFESRGNHALEGGRLLRTLGYPAIASLVERHVVLGPWSAGGRVTEAELLNYSDKRVRHEELVSLSARFEDILARYGGESDEAGVRIRRNWQTIEAVERKIFSRLPFGPDHVADPEAPPPPTVG